MNAFEFLHAPEKRARTHCGLSGIDAAMTEASKLAQDPMLLRSWETAFCSFLPHQERNVSAIADRITPLLTEMQAECMESGTKQVKRNG